jgi:hypothetical protein
VFGERFAPDVLGDLRFFDIVENLSVMPHLVLSSVHEFPEDGVNPWHTSRPDGSGDEGFRAAVLCGIES